MKQLVKIVTFAKKSPISLIIVIITSFAVTFITVVLFYALFLFADRFIVYPIRAKISAQHIIIEGTVQLGLENNRPITIDLISTAEGTYYLIDNTDEVSRRKKTTRYCPSEGTISCYMGKRVRVEGFTTYREMTIIPARFPSALEGNKPLNTPEPMKAQELVVQSFEVLE